MFRFLLNISTSFWLLCATKSQLNFFGISAHFFSVLIFFFFSDKKEEKTLEKVCFSFKTGWYSNAGRLPEGVSYLAFLVNFRNKKKDNQAVISSRDGLVVERLLHKKCHSATVDWIPSSMVYQSFRTWKTLSHIHINAGRQALWVYDTCLDVS